MGPAMEEYWTQRMNWCREAGITYWKVDWGVYEHDPAYRLFLTELAARRFPELIVEHAFCMGPMNGREMPVRESASDRFSEMSEVSRAARDIHRFSQVFRTYDVFNQMGVSTTLDRTAFLLEGEGGLLTCEDHVRIAASLGCTAGIMRSPYWNDIEGLPYDSTLLRRRLDEVTACVLWQRLALAFAGGKTVCSGNTLTDRWTFEQGECWMNSVFGKEIHQTAPAIIARGLPLPHVEARGEAPFLTCSQNPNGALTVAAHRRLLPERRETLPLCSVELEPERFPPFVGLLGSFRQVTVHLSRCPKQVLAQSLLAEEASDVTQRVRIEEDGTLIIPGELVEELYRPTAAPGDCSDPSVLFALR